MIILDTDHITILQYAGAPASDALVERLTGHPDQTIATTIVSAE